jgi:hypothetical protein
MLQNLKHVILLAVLSMMAACNGLTPEPKQQKIVFEVTSISCENPRNMWKSCDNILSSPRVKVTCNDVHESVSAYMNDGWRVVSSMNKVKFSGNYGADISCVGTEYILEK